MTETPMNKPRLLPTSLLLFLAFLLAAALPISAQDHSIDQNPQGINFAVGRPMIHTIFGQSPIGVAPLNLSNSSRVQGLLRNGKLYLSLDDSIALALENNLDIAIQRFNLPIADTDILRAKAGSTPRGVSTGVVSGTPGGGGATTGAAGASGAGAGGIVTSTIGGGPGVPQLDPTLNANFSLDDNVQPQGNIVVSGIPTVQSHATVANFSYSQGFLTGGSVNVGYN